MPKNRPVRDPTAMRPTTTRVLRHPPTTQRQRSSERKGKCARFGLEGYFSLTTNGWLP